MGQCPLAFNKHVRAVRSAVKFVSELPPKSVEIVAKAWRNYKVQESPFTVKLLSATFLKKRTICEASNWEAWLAPEPAKYY